MGFLVNISDIKDVYSHGQALSQCSKFIKSHNLIEHVRADTAGSAEMISKSGDKKAAIASSLSAKTYDLEIIKKNIENEKGNLTRFLVMGKIFCNLILALKNISHHFYLN